MPATSSPLSSLIELSAAERQRVLDGLSDEEAAALLYDWQSWARAEQLPPPGDWRIWLVLAGRGFGKTRVGAEWTREQAKEYELVNLIGPTTADVRDTMIEGESGIMAVCPPWERPVYRKSLRRLDWPSGAKSLCFSAEDPESLRGPQHERLWGDEVRAWPYMQETFDMAMLGLRLGPDPRACLTSTPRPAPLLRELVQAADVVISKGSTYDNEENLAPAFLTQITKRYEGTRLGRQELEAELLLDEGLAYRVEAGIHLVPPLPGGPPNWWHRFEAMDYGTEAPTSWGCFAVDADGNVLAFGLLHEPGFPSETAPRIHDRRAGWWARNEATGELERATCYAPRDIKTRWGPKDAKGNEQNAETEFNAHGIYFAQAQQDRRAGYIRISEMLKREPGRPFPDWHPHARTLGPDGKGAPRFYIVDSDEMEPLVENLRDAPLEDPESPLSKLPGEAVDEKWEHHHGHAHAMCRYALMSRPSPSSEPDPEPADPRAARIAERLKRLQERSKQGPDLIDV